MRPIRMLIRFSLLIAPLFAAVGAVSPLAAQGLSCAACAQDIKKPNECTPGSEGGTACTYASGSCAEIGTCSTQIVGTRQTPAGHELFEVMVGPDILIAERSSGTGEIRLVRCGSDGSDETTRALQRPPQPLSAHQLALRERGVAAGRSGPDAPLQ